MKSLVILGAGPAGLGAALFASRSSMFDQITLIEAQSQVGGLAQTVEWGGIGKHDLGPHKLFTLDKDLDAEVTKLLPTDQWLTRKKIARVFQNGQVMQYPPSVGDLVKYLKFRLPLAGIQFLEAKAFGRFKKDTNLEKAINNRVGRTLGGEIILPAIRKVWGDPSMLDASLAKTRIQIPSLKEIILSLLKRNKKSSDFEALTFKYPKSGLSNLWLAIERELLANGVSVIKNRRVESIKLENGNIKSIQLENGMQFDLSPTDLVVSTLSLNLFFELLGEKAPENETTMDLLLSFLHVSQKVDDVSWYFVPEKKLLTHRASSQSAFDPEMVPVGDIVCLEYMDSEGTLSEQEIVLRSQGEFYEIYGTDKKILACKVLRLKKSYPRFSNFDLELNHTQLLRAEKYMNFLTIGRHGAAQYVGSLDALDMGKKTMIWLENPTVQSKINYRDATSNYPVLD